MKPSKGAATVRWIRPETCASAEIRSGPVAKYPNSPRPISASSASLRPICPGPKSRVNCWPSAMPALVISQRSLRRFSSSTGAITVLTASRISRSCWVKGVSRGRS
ncbi:hypothetical protein R2601_02723 [Salipiger bermudensis HTCC2601]|uniref:Uncharacterized protein n=1 Tax=Salipiger bermudensis (strain DSM 26914 / JCM 13377 / KCTC 12554 / HTCC2601) TaxID=314265 RepID=Q0FWV1_SALBH|nr:hypothetical protein R2601_02723 [Salipiger bermudensis HTCC2601]